MTMTDDRMALFDLIEKTADADLVREMLAFAAERLMAMQVEALTGAPAGVRSPERLNHRNGYRDWACARGLRTRLVPSPTSPSPPWHLPRATSFLHRPVIRSVCRLR